MLRPSCAVTFVSVSEFGGPVVRASPELVRFSSWSLFRPQWRGVGEEETGVIWGLRLLRSVDGGAREAGDPKTEKRPRSSSLGAKAGNVGTLPDGWGTDGPPRGKTGPQEVLPSQKQLAL